MTYVATMALLGLISVPSGSPPQDPAVEAKAEVNEDHPGDLAARFDEAFNRADVPSLAALFADEAELIDEEGNFYRGRDEIVAVLGLLFEQFPGLTVTRETEEIRLIGPSLAIEDGVLTSTSKDQVEARNRYLTVLSRGEDGWKIASMRQVVEEPLPTPHEYIEPVAWIVGDWVSEEREQPVSLSFRWSDDGNFLLGGYSIETEGEVTLRTDQRIGWDASLELIRSWNFDSDGGFSEGRWSTDGSAWVVKSELVLPEGVTGSATFYLSPIDENRFVWSSLDRVIGGVVQPNIEVTIVRKPPAPQD